MMVMYGQADFMRTIHRRLPAPSVRVEVLCRSGDDFLNANVCETTSRDPAIWSGIGLQERIEVFGVLFRAAIAERLMAANFDKIALADLHIPDPLTADSEPQSR
jgi:hypothetical protein